MKRIKTGCVALLAAAACAAAQSNVSDTHKYAWQENTGWTNWRDAGSPAGDQGVTIHPSYLTGSIWFENTGWLSVGKHPLNGTLHYPNLTGADAGVNILAGGDLAGFAWGENVGWVIFDTGSLGEKRARFDHSSCRFRGYAWGENIGWLNLDDASQYIGSACYADCDLSCSLDVNDFSCFLNKFAAGDSYANCDGSSVSPTLNVVDFICFMNSFAAGCP